MQNSYSQYAVEGRAGQPYIAGYDVRTLTNSKPAVAQIDTITVDVATHSHLYTLTIDGSACNYQADSATSQAEISAGLAAAVNANPYVNGYVVAADATPAFTITARYPGRGFTASNVDAKCTNVHTLADDDSDPIPVGRAVLVDPTAADLGMICSYVNMVAQVVVLTPAAVNDLRYTVEIEVEGTHYAGTYLADGSASAQEIVEGLVASLNGLLPASTVVATEDNTTMTLTSEVPGMPFTVITGPSLVVTSNNGPTNRLTDVNRCIAGVTQLSGYLEATDNDTIVYPANSAMNVISCGQVIVANEDTVTAGKDVFVRVDGTASTGQFRATTAASCVRLKKYRWVKPLSSTLAVLGVEE